MSNRSTVGQSAHGSLWEVASGNCSQDRVYGGVRGAIAWCSFSLALRSGAPAHFTDLKAGQPGSQ